MTNIKRIEVGNSKFESINESTEIVFAVPFEFSSEEISLDSDVRTFDEN